MNTDGYSTDDSTKRRRQDLEDEDVFKKSRKTERSPNKNFEKKIDKLLQLMEDMSTEMKDIKKELKETRTELRETNKEIKILKKENDDIKRKYEEMKKQNEEIHKEMRIVKNNMDYIEKEMKRNNIVISGVNIDTKDPKMLQQDMNNFMERKLGIKINIKAAYKLATKVCLLELENNKDKELVMNNKQKLKNIKDERIFISNDLTKLEREIQKQIKIRAEKEKKEGKTVKIKYNKLIIENKVWRWNKVEGKLEESKN